jgi:hypothetical protein
MKTRLVGAEVFHADRRTDGRTDRQTDLTKLLVAFRNFANAPNERPEPGCASIHSEVTVKIVLKLKVPYANYEL